MKTRRWKADRKKTTAILWDRFTKCCLLRAFQRLSFKHDRSKKNRTFSAYFFRQAYVVWANVVFELILLLCGIEILDRPQQHRRAALLTSATFFDYHSNHWLAFVFWHVSKLYCSIRPARTKQSPSETYASCIQFYICDRCLIFTCDRYLFPDAYEAILFLIQQMTQYGHLWVRCTSLRCGCQSKTITQ